MRKLPIEIRPFEKLNLSNKSKEIRYQCSVLFLTYISYIGYHMARKSLSIVKTSETFINCSSTICSLWITELDDKSENAAMSTLGLLDTTYLVTYAIFVFVVGPVAERVDLRLFLTIGMLGTGLMNILFGLAYSTGIHSIWYFVTIQILFGMFQTTGWLGVLSVVAKWFGKGKRGLIMGVWHSHTSIGNIFGALVAGIFAADNWGLSFIVPGLIVVIIGVLIFFFLVPDPSIVGLSQETDQQLESTHSSKSSSSSSITQLIETSNSCSDLTTSDFECKPLVPHKDQPI
jgi:OPA family glycerol-3-phosphate transporter-like MFS transporter 1/2